MLTYVYLGTNDLERATRFYDATLAPLGMERCITGDPGWDRTSAGWGIYQDDGIHELALWVGRPFDGRPATAGNGVMVALGSAVISRGGRRFRGNVDRAPGGRHGLPRSSKQRGMPASRASRGDYVPTYVADAYIFHSNRWIKAKCPNEPASSVSPPQILHGFGRGKQALVKDRCGSQP